MKADRKYVVRWRRRNGPWLYFGAAGVGVLVLGHATLMSRQRAELAERELETAMRTNGRYLIVEIVAHDDAPAEGRCQ